MMKFCVAVVATASLVSIAIAGPIQSRGFSGGDVTYYGGGLTACGINLVTDTQDGVALSFHVFDSFPAVPVTNPNLNPICKVKVKAFMPSTGKSITIPVVDKCSGCKDADLDLSRKSFLALGLEFAQGRIPGVQWEFVSAGDPVPTSTTSLSTYTTETTETRSTTQLTKTGNSVDPTKSRSAHIPETTETTETGTAAEPTTTGSDSESTKTDTSKNVEPTKSSSTSITETSQPTVEPTKTPTTQVTETTQSTKTSSAYITETMEPSRTGNTAEPTTAVPTETETTSEPNAPEDTPSPLPITCIEAWNACNEAYTGSTEDIKSYNCHEVYAACSRRSQRSQRSQRSTRMKKNRIIAF